VPLSHLTPQPARQKPVTVLLVDDDEIDIMGVKREFKRSDVTNLLTVANNGMEALEKLRDGSVPSPRMVLLDLNMPRMNGIEFLKQARQDPKLKDTVIFVLTTSKAEEDKKAAYAHNIAGYIVKDRTNNGFVDVAGLLGKYASVVEFP